MNEEEFTLRLRELALLRNREQAIQEVTEFASSPSLGAAQRSQVFALRGDLFDSCGLLDRAAQDWAFALSLGPMSIVAKYSLHVAIAGVSDAKGDEVELLYQLRNAVQCSYEDPKLFVARPVRRIVELVDAETLRQIEKELLDALDENWKFRNLENSAARRFLVDKISTLIDFEDKLNERISKGS
jgi:hypothetical protein